MIYVAMWLKVGDVAEEKNDTGMIDELGGKRVSRVKSDNQKK